MRLGKGGQLQEDGDGGTDYLSSGEICGQCVIFRYLGLKHNRF
jgi:hypothetical protein